MTNYYVVLEDSLGLANKKSNGFYCSPKWCNMYLATYKARFILHLVRLEKKDLLTKFQIAFRYIDGLCLINVQNPRDFLSPKQPHIEDNPF